VAFDARSGIPLALLVLAAACAPPPLALPSGDSTPLADPSLVVNEATQSCAGLRSLTAEIGLAGTVGRAKLRGRLQAGFAAPDALRVEAVAPFGAPMFVLAGRGGHATLWLPRDDRVLKDTDPAEILDALAGLHVSPADLRAWLGGCPTPGFLPGDARRYGADWVRVDGRSTGAIWLRHSDRWRLVEERTGPLAVELTGYTGAGPGRVRIRHEGSDPTPAIDVRLTIGQLETNVALEDAAFAVDVPSSARPIAIDELRASGPLRAADQER
jgi:hypothetical protein